MENRWRLGDDMISSDNILDGLTFDDLILSVHHTSVVNPKTVRDNLKDMLESRLEDMWFIVERNMDVIIAEALKGRG